VLSIAGLSAIIRSFQEREIGGTDAPEQSGGVSPEESHTTKRPQAMRRPLLKAARCARRPNGCDVGPWPPARASFGGCLSAAFFLSRPYTVTFFLLVGFATRHCAAGIYQRQPGIESDHLPRQLLRLDAALCAVSLLTVYMIMRVRWTTQAIAVDGRI